MMSTSGSGDAVTKKFSLKVGDMDRVAFYIPSKFGASIKDL